MKAWAVAALIVVAGCGGGSGKKTPQDLGGDSGDLSSDGGTCTPSSCTGVCAAGKCALCTTDLQCQMQTPGTICSAAGACVTASCTTGSACANPADVCCGNTCVAGSCCTSADCSTAGQGCTNHVCTTCASPSPSPGGTIVELYVDGSEGVNAKATGADQQGCRFGSITAALTSLNGNGPAHIHVANTAPLTTATGEVFPIAVLPYVTITGTGSPAPTLSVASRGQTGVQLAAGTSLSNLTIDGANNTAFQGVLVDATSSQAASPAPTLDHVLLQHFSACAIEVNDDSVLSLLAGVVATNNGRGLCIEKTTQASVSVTNSSTLASDEISFDRNNGDGVSVIGGTLTMVGSAAQTTVDVSNNSGTGILVEPLTTAITLTNVRISNNGTAPYGDALSISPGVAATVRGCTLTGNIANGVHILWSNASGTSDASSINLGTDDAVSQGGNLFSSNGGADICIDIPLGTSSKINAEGNTFGATNCATTAGTLTDSRAGCTGGVNIGAIATPSPAPSTSTQINLGMCSPS